MAGGRPFEKVQSSASFRTCVQNRVQYAPIVPYLARCHPVQVIDLVLSEVYASASQAGCHGFDPRLPLHKYNHLAVRRFLLCAQKCSEYFEFSLYPLPGFGSHHVIGHCIHQLSYALRHDLGVFVKSCPDITVTQVRLYIFRIPESLGVRRECASKDLEVHWHCDSRSSGNRFDATSQPVLRTHRRPILSGEDESINRRVGILRAPQFQRRNQNVWNYD
jgi:hypothetical protein